MFSLVFTFFFRVKIKTEDNIALKKGILDELFFPNYRIYSDPGNNSNSETLEDNSITLMYRKKTNSDKKLFCSIKSHNVPVYVLRNSSIDQKTMYVQNQDKKLLELSMAYFNQFYMLVYDIYRSQIVFSYRELDNFEVADILEINSQSVYVYGSPVDSQFLRCAKKHKDNTRDISFCDTITVIFTFLLVSRVIFSYFVSNVVILNSEKTSLDIYKIEKDNGTYHTYTKYHFKVAYGKCIKILSESFIRDFSSTNDDCSEKNIDFKYNGLDSKVIISNTNEDIKSEEITYHFLHRGIFLTFSDNIVFNPNLESFKVFLTYVSRLFYLQSMSLYMWDHETSTYNVVISINHSKSKDVYIPIDKVYFLETGHCATIKYKGRTYKASEVSFGKSKYAIIACILPSHRLFVSDLYSRMILLCAANWHQIITQRRNDNLYENYSKYITESKNMCTIEYDCSKRMNTVVMNTVPAELESDPLYKKNIEDLIENGTPINSRVYTTNTGENQKWYSVIADKFFDSTTRSDILTTVIEDVSNIYKNEIKIKESTENNAFMSKLIGFHFYENDNMADSLSKELGYKEKNIRMSEIVDSNDMTVIQGLSPGEKITITMRDSDNRDVFYSVVSTGLNKGFVCMDETVKINTILNSVQMLERFGQTSNFFAIWIVYLSDSSGNDLENPFRLPIFTYNDFIAHIHHSDLEHVSLKSLYGLEGSKTVELKMKIALEADFQPFLTTIARIDENKCILSAFNNSILRNTSSLLSETEYHLSLVSAYSDIHMWRFNENNINSIVYTGELGSEKYVEFGWQTLKHNVTLEYQEKAIEAFKDAFKTGTLDIELPFFFEKPHWLLLRGISVGENELHGIYIDSTDMKETIKMIQKQKVDTQEAVSAKIQFLTNISHEVMTQTTEMSVISTALMTSKLNYEQREMIECVHNSVLDLLELLNDSFDLSKIETGALEFNSECFDLQSSIYSVTGHYFPSIQKKGLDYLVKIYPDTPFKFIGDSFILSRILSVLLSNAVKFTEKGFISTEITSPNDSLVLTVQDTGKGITNEALDHIRNHFDKGPTISVGEKNHVGVGLSLAIALIKLSHGSFEITSTVNEGTKVVVTLPFEPTYYLTPPPFKDKIKIHAGFLGEEIRVRQITIQFLEFFGITYSTFTDDDLKNSLYLYDILIIDYDNPDKQEVFKYIRTNNLFDNKSIVILTSRSDVDIQDAAVFKKPLDFILFGNYLYTLVYKCRTMDHIFLSTQQILSCFAVLVLEDGPSTNCSGTCYMKRIGYNFCSKPIASFVDSTLGFDAVMFWIKEEKNVHDAAVSIRMLRRTGNRIPIICVLMNDDLQKELCINAGANICISAPLDDKLLTTTLQKFNINKFPVC